MSFRERARHECGDGTEILVGEDRRGELLVFDGPGGLETTIRFDEVAFSTNRIECFVYHQASAGVVRIKSGQLERDDLGDVTEWLEAHATPEASA